MNPNDLSVVEFEHYIGKHRFVSYALFNSSIICDDAVTILIETDMYEHDDRLIILNESQLNLVFPNVFQTSDKEDK